MWSSLRIWNYSFPDIIFQIEILIELLRMPEGDVFNLFSAQEYKRLAKASHTNGESEHPYLFPDFRGNAFNYSQLRLVMTVNLL